MLMALCFYWNCCSLEMVDCERNTTSRFVYIRPSLHYRVARHDHYNKNAYINFEDVFSVLDFLALAW